MHSLSLAFVCFFVGVFLLRWAKISNVKDVSVPGDVLIVFAHPDDEAMFFTPLLKFLHTRNIGVHFLCLSNGNDNGLGKVREKELAASGAFFGVQRHNIKIVDRAELQDGMRNAWCTTAIRREIEAYMQKAGNISTIVTFDKYGVSGHPNHIAVHNGVRELKENMPPGLIYLQLRTRNLFMKYIGPLAVLPYATFSASYVSRTNFSPLIHPASSWASMAAMQCHASQLVWFRYLFVLFSSYTYVNELEEL
ncbi:N-acetylglucosaminyl-phosphatidylinositol deacetylase [Leptomonas seymouri]|uniref:N-acetylglucosaminylphosphatidylinositol deacetylase n=1 Tax=Leptomonas seymouri TaxID=5684 RepID=A0A0N1I1P5_LEPSE|nr:N-acetylglucosaminyl-phosphatidylinositol deacetylase [Leptomonas seymouri]|eukprot:KPI83343.1 N-acetylglucosaminyl-phosphatidylinositol deacetylase [Leptomonas seymouri]